MCRLAAVEFLQEVLVRGCVVLDLAGEIEAEYHRYLSPRGQPGVGDRFYLEVLNSAPGASSECRFRETMRVSTKIFP